MGRLRSCVVLIIGILGISLAGENRPAACPEIVSRATWGARSASAITYMAFPVPYAVIIHTATPECNTTEQCTARVLNTQHFHMSERNFDDIAFSFLIGGDGRIYEGVGWHKVGSHTRGYNSRSLGIALIGNFEDVLPNESMLTALRKLLACGVQTGELKTDYKLLAHSQLSSTVSPGMTFYNALQKWPHWASAP